MVRNYAAQLSMAIGREDAGALISRAVTRVGQLLCGIRGHDALLHFEGKRVMMRCTSCGHDTPGWEISERGPRRRFEGDTRRHLLPSRRRLVLRKTA